MMSRPGRVQDMARRILLATAYGGWKLCSHDAANVTMILRAIGERSALAPLHSLALCCGNAFLNFSPEDKDIAMESVMYLSHLSLEVWSNDCDVLVNVIESGKLREFLEWTSGSQGLCQCDPTYPWVANPPQGLLSLSFSLGETWESPGSLSDILGTIHWPCLQKFEPTSFSFSLKELIDFFNRHRSSLLYLGLNEVTLPTGFLVRGVHRDAWAKGATNTAPSEPDLGRLPA